MRGGKTVSLLLAILVCFSLAGAGWASGEAAPDSAAEPAPLSGDCGDGVGWTLSDDGVLTVSGAGPMAGSAWYEYRDGVRTAVIEEGVTGIAAYAFSGCRYMTGVRLPASLERIEFFAFDGCTAVTDVTYAGTDEQWAGVSVLPGNECITAPMLARTGRVGGTAGALFWTLTADGALTVSGAGAMTEAPWLAYRSSIRAVVIEEGVTGVCASAFNECGALSSVSLPASLTGIDYSAFYNCGALTDVAYAGTDEQWLAVSLADGSEAVCAAMLARLGGIGGTCGTALTWTLTGDGTLTVSGSGPMDEEPAPWYPYMTGIRTAVLEEGVTTVSASAFSGADALERAILPRSLESVGIYAFESCGSLTELIYPGTDDDWAELDIDIGNDCLTLARDGALSGVFGDDISWTLRRGGTLTITGTGEMDAGLGSASWGENYRIIRAIEIGEGFTDIVPGAFWGYSNLERLSLPASLQTIGQSAFYGCGRLARIDYAGTRAQWEALAIDRNGSGPLYGAALHCADDVPTVWAAARLLAEGEFFEAARELQKSAAA